VVWFSMPTEIFKNRQLFDLYRRQILVSATPDAGVFVGNSFASPGASEISWRAFAGGSVLNSLADLSVPTNRFVSQRQDYWRLEGNRSGEDVILRNVLSFDVKFVPQAVSAFVPTFPNPYPLTAIDGAFETSATGNSTHSPLRALQVTITCLEKNTNEERVIEVLHSFGQERIQYPEP